MSAAGGWILQMGDSLQQVSEVIPSLCLTIIGGLVWFNHNHSLQEEERLRKRAQDLRKVSAQAFKLMSEIKQDDQE